MKKVIAQKTEKYLTISVFEKHMGSIARSFGEVDARFERIDKRLAHHDTVFERMFSMIQDVQESNREIHNDIRGYMHHTVTGERRVDDLTERVEKLERKTANI